MIDYKKKYLKYKKYLIEKKILGGRVSSGGGSGWAGWAVE